MSEDTVSIVIANWNTTKYMNEKTIPAAKDYTMMPTEIIVVDSGSDDAPPDEISRLADTAIYLGKNYGPSRAWNAGCAAATGDFLCILNSDCVVGKGCIDMLVEACRMGPAIAAARADTEQGRFSRNHESLIEVPDGDYVSFVCVVMLNEIYQELGQFDEEYGSGAWEDVDYAFRAQDNGYRIVVDPNAECWHEISLSRKNNKGRGLDVRVDGKERFYKKWKPKERPRPIA